MKRFQVQSIEQVPAIGKDGKPTSKYVLGVLFAITDNVMSVTVETLDSDTVAAILDGIHERLISLVELGE